MDKQELKKVAEDILVGIATHNYQLGLTVESDLRNMSDEDYMELENLIKTANISITWDE